MKPCSHQFSEKNCRICWLYDNDRRYRELWGGNPLEIVHSEDKSQAPASSSNLNEDQKKQLDKIKMVIRKPCIHLGLALEEKPSCGCNGSKSAILHECAKHGKCRPYAPRQDENRQCVQCPDYIDGKS